MLVAFGHGVLSHPIFPDLCIGPILAIFKVVLSVYGPPHHPGPIILVYSFWTQ